MFNRKEIMDFFMNLDFGECFENVYASRKNEKVRVFLGMVKDKKGVATGISVCSPTRKNPVEIQYKLNQIKPKKSFEVPVHPKNTYRNLFQKTLLVGFLL